MVESTEATCAICGKNRPKGQCKVVKLTAAEKHQLREAGYEPQEEYIYCRFCWKNMADSVSGPAFMKSLFEVMLTTAGVGNAENLAKRYHVWLSKRAREPKA